MTADALEVYIGRGPVANGPFDNPNWTITQVTGPDGERHYVARPSA